MLELRDEIALIDTRISDLLTRLDTGESGPLWHHLRSVRDTYASGALKEREHTLATMFAIIDAGVADFALWAEIRTFIEQRRRLVESEWKRQIELRQMLTTEQALVWAGALAQTIKDVVTRQCGTDTALARRILTDIGAAFDTLMAKEER